ncbi:glycosyltransferase [Mycolicibacterium sp. S2-37]|uniref:glycosyltransferase n=1 Tax=Mycolicibacterium sp. S2-37 TaxID=2810297 RepID=UPI001A953315|nr:glycosyltransferase [Mycolicibacterium sp. S2-37]MBO0678595.1 glycosyltransferase [Mycolicibacterium sp. S2-37]
MTLADQPIPLRDGRCTVPGNRWDLVTGHADADPAVAVVIPYYNQQRQLDLVLAALAGQTYPARLMQVVVADDGSAQAPALPRSPLDIRVVRQDDLGFRAAAARNLGAAATDAAVLCFLDADTVPEPDYLRALTRLPAQLPDALVVGRRRYAHLGDHVGAIPAEAPPHPLPEPRWLSDAYTATGDLLHLDHRSYRYIISSVMCCSADLFSDIGGFDESFVGYGGEDWEFAHRAVTGGAVLHHAADAVAWHDGPDWAGRDVADRAAVKNAEALALSRRITDPDARRTGLRYALPDVAVSVEADGHTASSLVATVSGFLGEDVGVWVHGAAADRLLGQIGAADERLHVGPVPAEVLRRCRFVVTTAGRVVLTRPGAAALLRACSGAAVGTAQASTAGAAVTCRATWALNRARRWVTGAVRFADPADAGRISRTVSLDPESVELRCGPAEPDLSW